MPFEPAFTLLIVLCDVQSVNTFQLIALVLCRLAMTSCFGACMTVKTNYLTFKLDLT